MQLHHYVRLALWLIHAMVPINAQLPTLYFAILAAGLMLEHFIFAKRTRWSVRAKTIAFGITAGSVVGTFLLFRGAAFGFDGAPSPPFG